MTISDQCTPDRASLLTWHTDSSSKIKKKNVTCSGSAVDKHFYKSVYHKGVWKGGE